ncbi:peptidoglycan bridge formation glycyltransferase FemA/FemB family protein [Periweissella cryptocerci]|uniref:Peptidoglycan bridge formation glycyltransferase FemA/FemB family protein n=1 Tax=Periweissella cryptocerci TaxID=2506420 RepID=A0A4P6YSR3_9LACO|nr:peptidoglycan bridge formation glycyltransferase FemA/FemB family protein [Periweissella cryptocerci]QBO35706.1 peptidoglycan bridge formation glycyltransferase FemA/FemB family protein [Periweissella cryptocerci]
MPVVNLNDAAEVARYQDFVRSANYSSVTQDLGWGKTKANWQPMYVYVENAGEIVAGLSILSINNLNDKKLAYASKGPVFKDEFSVELLKALVDEAKSALEAANTMVLRIDPEVVYSDELNNELKALGFTMRNRNLSLENAHATIQPRFNMLLDLVDQDEESLIATFHKKTRYNIRLAERKGVEVESGNSKELMDVFYETYKEMSIRHGITYRPAEYFDRMLEAFPEDSIMRIYIARHEGDVLSGAIAFNFGDKVWYMYGGSTEIKRNFMAPQLVQWEMIKWAMNTGKKRYDMGGIFGFDNTDGLYHFKQGFAYPNKITEYIGEIDYVFDADTYKEFTKDSM